MDFGETDGDAEGDEQDEFFEAEESFKAVQRLSLEDPRADSMVRAPSFDLAMEEVRLGSRQGLMVCGIETLMHRTDAGTVVKL